MLLWKTASPLSIVHYTERTTVQEGGKLINENKCGISKLEITTITEKLLVVIISTGANEIHTRKPRMMAS